MSFNHRIAKFVDKQREGELTRLENMYTSINFLVNYVSNFFAKYINKIKRQNSIVTKMGIDLKQLAWFENAQGNLVFNSSIELKTLNESKQEARLVEGNGEEALVLRQNLENSRLQESKLTVASEKIIVMPKMKYAQFSTLYK